MILLRHGDYLPIVATVQLLLNALLSDVRPLVVDGIYGVKTEQAVTQFQQQEQVTADGRINPPTWALLTRHVRFQVRDIVDVFDHPVGLGFRDTLGTVGSRPIVFGGGSNAVGWIAPSLLAAGVAAHTLVLLRFHGHGNQGAQVIGYGTGCHVLFDAIRGQPGAMPDLHRCTPRHITISPEEREAVNLAIGRSRISLSSLALPDVVAALTPLRPLFAPFGCVEFHGCQVGGGEKGVRFLRQVATLLGVPAVAAQHSQTTGNAIRFSGPVRMAFPSGSLRDWAGNLPAINQSF